MYCQAVGNLMPLAVHDKMSHEVPAVANERYIVIVVECSRCKTNQKVHVAVRTVATKMADELIRCLDCDKVFKAKLPDKIIDGPFPP
jgi:hypothetical protein